MRLWVSLLLPGLIGAVRPAPDTAKVYLLEKPEHGSSSATPTLTPREARLVFSQRLGVSQYHSLRHASDDTLAHINTYGRREIPLFSDVQDDERAHMVVVVESSSADVAQRVEKILGSVQPAFEISNPPSSETTARLVEDLTAQISLFKGYPKCALIDAVDPYQQRCWAGNSKILHLNAQDSTKLFSSRLILDATAAILRHVQSEGLDVMLVMMPASSVQPKHGYGSYDMPQQSRQARDAQREEPIELPQNSPFHAQNGTSPNNRTNITTPRTFAFCYESNKTCLAATNNCSGHGSCYLKYGSSNENDESSCYTCQCIPSIKITNTTRGEQRTVTNWGGAACHKEDVSSPFWLLLGISVVLIFVVSSGVGMLFSIGEEKLPGVIGAGVSGPKAR